MTQKSQGSANWSDYSATTQILHSTQQIIFNMKNILNISRFRNCSSESHLFYLWQRVCRFQLFHSLCQCNELSAVTVSAHQLIFSCSPLLEHVTAVILFSSDGFPVIMLSHLDLCLNYMLIFLYKDGGESISWINSEQSDNPGRIMHW